MFDRSSRCGIPSQEAQLMSLLDMIVGCAVSNSMDTMLSVAPMTVQSGTVGLYMTSHDIHHDRLLATLATKPIINS